MSDRMEPLLEQMSPPCAQSSSPQESFSGGTHDSKCLETSQPTPHGGIENDTAEHELLKSGAELNLNHQSHGPRVAIAVILICINQVGNVGSSELTQYQETNGAKPFDSPYFSIWFNHSVTGLGCYFVALLQCWLYHKKTVLQMLQDSGFSVREACADSILLGVVYQMFNVCWAAAVPHTTVSVFLAISQSACVPVLLFSWCFLRERIGAVKALSVLSCVGGVVVVSLHQTEKKGNGNIVGLIWTFCFTILYAAYMLLWAVKVGKRVQSTGQDCTLFIVGMLGIGTLLLMWPPILVLYFSGVQPQLLPAGMFQWKLVLYNAALATFNNTLFMLAISASSPLFVSVGSILQIPVSAIADYLLHGEELQWQSGVGYGLIAAGFVALSMHHSTPRHDHDQNGEDAIPGNTKVGRHSPGIHCDEQQACSAEHFDGMA